MLVTPLTSSTVVRDTLQRDQQTTTRLLTQQAITLSRWAALIVSKVGGFKFGQLYAPEFMRRLAAVSVPRDDLTAMERDVASVAR
jgi:hypothetical protein